MEQAVDRGQFPAIGTGAGSGCTGEMMSPILGREGGGVGGSSTGIGAGRTVNKEEGVASNGLSGTDKSSGSGLISV